MSLDSFQTLVLAALWHDLGELVGPHEVVTRAAADAQLEPLLTQARQWASPAGAHTAPLANSPLVAALSLLNLDDAAQVAPRYFPFHPLVSTAADWQYIFPTPLPDASRAAYLDRFKREWQARSRIWRDAAFDVQLHHSAACLHEYAWCLPAHDTHVSLYDQARLTAALAACLYRARAADVAADHSLRLAAGDLSGIQDYIFDIATVGAAGASRRLRARSFSIAMLSDLASHALAQRFELPLTNILMSSGGKFYVLLPNVPEAETRLQEFRRQVDEWLYQNYNGEIGLNLASLPLGARQLDASRPDGEGFGAFLGRLNRALEVEKNRRGHSLWQADAAWNEARFVIPQDFGGAGDCASCHKFAATERDNLCVQCATQSRLGSKLTRAWGIAFRRGAAGEAEDITFLDDYHARVLTNAPAERLDPAVYLLARLNDPDLSRVTNYPATFRYLTNHIERRADDMPLDFAEIARHAQGRDLLGYVKADVDHLGLLMAEGLRAGDDAASHDTAGQVMALSRELELFFSGWLEHLLATNFKTAYTIFSGGDDLFLIVPWSDAISLAQQVHDRFGEFVCANPAVHLSAGILYAKAGYPISRAAQDAERALELSKDLGRDRLTVLGDTLAWRNVKVVTDQVAKLSGFSEQDMRSAFLYRLTDYAEMYRLAQQAHTAEAARYKSHLAYTVARNLRQSRRETQDWADALLRELFQTGTSDVMQHLGVIATIVLFTRRTRRGN